MDEAKGSDQNQLHLLLNNQKKLSVMADKDSRPRMANEARTYNWLPDDWRPL